MFKKMFCCLLVISILMPSYGGYAQKSFGQATVYTITPNTYWKFINDEDVSIFNNNDLDTATFKNDDNGMITWSKTNNGILYHGQVSISRVADLPVSNKFVDFFGSYSNIQSYLSSQGVNAKINHFFVFAIDEERFSDEFQVPVSAYVQTNGGNYFITLNEDPYANKDQIMEKDKQEDYLFKLYKSQDYINKYNLKQGSIVVNGNKISSSYAQISSYGAYVPMRDILESLGCKVTWDDTNKEIQVVSRDNKKISLKFKAYNNLEIYDTNMKSLDPFLPYSYNIVDGKTVLYYQTMKDLVKTIWGDSITTNLATDKLTVDFKLN